MLDISKNWALSWLIGILALITVSLNPTQKALVSWTPPEGAEWYYSRLRSLDLKPQIITEKLKITDTETPAIRPRSGHWAFEVQACKLSEGEELCSEWVKSDVDGSPEPWVIFWKPPPTTGLTINDYTP